MKNIKNKYVQLSDIDHVLLRPDSYIGSCINKKDYQYILKNGKLIKQDIIFNYGLFKLFDEIITNSVDEHIRNRKLNKIKITITKDSLSIIDNGGIASTYISKYSCSIPELIFGNLRTSSNYDDSENRQVAGTNGFGAKISNIYSLLFSVETSFNKIVYKQVWKNNMKEVNKPTTYPLKRKRNYTKILFKPDLERFGVTEISDDMLSAMKKRCIDLAALNNKLEISFNNKIFKFDSFESYCNLYSLENELFYCEDNNWKIGITTSNGSFNQTSFANNTFNNLGGSHVDYILNQIVNYLRPLILKKYKIDVKPSEIRNQLTLFINATIVNNRFSSQTKERLITDSNNFGNSFKIPESVLIKVFKSEIVQRLLDWKKTKNEIAEKIELRKLNKKVEKLKVPNLIDCSSKNRNSCEIFIFEGFSAANGFLKYRDTKKQAAYLLKGKILNTYNLKLNKIIQNKEVAGLVATIGLRLGYPSIKNLRYGKILIVTDMDVDGANICSLLINFLASNWIDLFKWGIVYRVITPLMILKNGKKQYNIYSDDEYHEFISKNKSKSYRVEYKKGLGALSNSDYKAMMKSPKLLRITYDELYEESLDNWFGKDSGKRKSLLLGEPIVKTKVKTKVKNKVKTKENSVLLSVLDLL